MALLGSWLLVLLKRGPILISTNVAQARSALFLLKSVKREASQRSGWTLYLEPMKRLKQLSQFYLAYFPNHMQHFFYSFEAWLIILLETRARKMGQWASPVALSCGLGARWAWFSIGFAGFFADFRLFFCGLMVSRIVFFFAILLSYVPKKE